MKRIALTGALFILGSALLAAESYAADEPSQVTPLAATPDSPPPPQGQTVNLEQSELLKNHISIGVPLSAHAIFTLSNGSIASFLGLLAAPELRYARTLTASDRWRYFLAVRYTGLRGVMTRLDSGMRLGMSSRSYDVLGITGASLTFHSTTPSTRSTVTFAAAGVSLGVGFGSIQYADNVNAVGVTLMLSLDLDLVSFNF